MAGSRREYLAADDLKIYITVKLSSAMDAYQGFDVDDRSKFNVAIIYEDGAAGKRAKHFYDRVIRELVDECEFSLELWSVQVLAVPEIGNSAAKAQTLSFSQCTAKLSSLPRPEIGSKDGPG